MNTIDLDWFPHNERDLLERCDLIAGITLLQLSHLVKRALPKPEQKKGWIGQAIELVLGGSAGNVAAPDFIHLGIELKTIPVDEYGVPMESTFITSIALLTIYTQNWLSSQCYAKLRRILWVPVEGARHLHFADRRVGKAFLWSPTIKEMVILQQDWTELTDMISIGNIDKIHAGIGEYLHIRPKALNNAAVCYAFDNNGDRILTLPRGFYLRRSFTKTFFR